MRRPRRRLQARISQRLLHQVRRRPAVLNRGLEAEGRAKRSLPAQAHRRPGSCAEQVLRADDDETALFRGARADVLLEARDYDESIALSRDGIEAMRWIYGMPHIRVAGEWAKRLTAGVEADGVFVEVHAFRTRFFVPTEERAARAVTEHRSVVEVRDR